MDSFGHRLLIFKSTNNLYFKYSKWELSDLETWVLGIGSALDLHKYITCLFKTSI